MGKYDRAIFTAACGLLIYGLGGGDFGAACAEVESASPSSGPGQASPDTPPQPVATFILGADISWVQQQEARGRRFSDKGVEGDVLDILKDHGFNSIRLRIFHNPRAPEGYSKEGYCGLEHTLRMARRVKAAGMGLLLDFHYSDTWADPGKQRKPEAWRQLSFDELQKAVYEYTKQVLVSLREQGTAPQIVQIGNEINHGFLWPDGSTKDWDRFAALLKAGIRAVREANPSAKIMLHIACGGQNDESRGFLDNALKRELDFDLIGESYYPRWHGTLEDLRNNLTDLAQRYTKPILLVEYSARNIRQINDIVHGLPNGRGIGTFIWEPTSGALFDREGKTTSEIDAYVEIAEEYAAR